MISLGDIGGVARGYLKADDFRRQEAPKQAVGAWLSALRSGDEMAEQTAFDAMLPQLPPEKAAAMYQMRDDLKKRGGMTAAQAGQIGATARGQGYGMTLGDQGPEFEPLGEGDLSLEEQASLGARRAQGEASTAQAGYYTARTNNPAAFRNPTTTPRPRIITRPDGSHVYEDGTPVPGGGATKPPYDEKDLKTETEKIVADIQDQYGEWVKDNDTSKLTFTRKYKPLLAQAHPELDRALREAKTQDEKDEVLLTYGFKAARRKLAIMAKLGLLAPKEDEDAEKSKGTEISLPGASEIAHPGEAPAVSLSEGVPAAGTAHFGPGGDRPSLGGQAPAPEIPEQWARNKIANGMPPAMVLKALQEAGYDQPTIDAVRKALSQ